MLASTSPSSCCASSRACALGDTRSGGGPRRLLRQQQETGRSRSNTGGGSILPRHHYWPTAHTPTPPLTPPRLAAHYCVLATTCYNPYVVNYHQYKKGLNLLIQWKHLLICLWKIPMATPSCIGHPPIHPSTLWSSLLPTVTVMLLEELGLDINKRTITMKKGYDSCSLTVSLPSSLGQLVT